jgi:hypothetical protein
LLKFFACGPITNKHITGSSDRYGGLTPILKGKQIPLNSGNADFLKRTLIKVELFLEKCLTKKCTGCDKKTVILGYETVRKK